MRIRREQTPLAAREINMSQNHWSKRKWRMLYNQDPRERRVDTSWDLLLLSLPLLPFLPLPVLPPAAFLPFPPFTALLSPPPPSLPASKSLSSDSVQSSGSPGSLQWWPTGQGYYGLEHFHIWWQNIFFPCRSYRGHKCHKCLKWVYIQESWIVPSVLHVHNHWVGGKDRDSVAGGIKRKIASGRREGEEWQADSDQSKSNPQRFKGQT